MCKINETIKLCKIRHIVAISKTTKLYVKHINRAASTKGFVHSDLSHKLWFCFSLCDN